MPLETSYTQLRQRLAAVLDRVVADREVVIVRRRGAGDVALVLADELSSLMETAHLLRSTQNAARLLAAPTGAGDAVNRSRSFGRRWALAERAEREAVFRAEFRDDLRHWLSVDRKVALRILDLVEAVMRDPFSGVGKPEPLRFVLAGFWSRRVAQEHRLVYRVSGKRIDFLQACYHYQGFPPLDLSGRRRAPNHSPRPPPA